MLVAQTYEFGRSSTTLGVRVLLLMTLDPRCQHLLIVVHHSAAVCEKLLHFSKLTGLLGGVFR